MVKQPKTAMGKRLERAAVSAGKELGSVVARMEREAVKVVRRGHKMQAAARRRSIQLMRRGARSLEKLAAQLEKAGS